MDRLATLDLFVRIVDRGSFTAAAASCGVSRPVATATIKALEPVRRPTTTTLDPPRPAHRGGSRLLSAMHCDPS